MEMRIVVQDGASATSLAERLSAVFGAERIALWGDRRAVDIQVERESDHVVLQVLDAVERWLDQAAVGSAEMWLGEHSYKVARWIPIEEGRL
ncbi:MAG: hypothetical protein ACXVZ2_07005 [Gaiellaceae bacterium]